jgi:hypothetical protein
MLVASESLQNTGDTLEGEGCVLGCELICWGIQGYSVNPKAEFEKGHVYSLLKLIQILVRGPVHWITEPDSDPAIFFSGSQDAIKKSFFYYLLYR